MRYTQIFGNLWPGMFVLFEFSGNFGWNSPSFGISTIFRFLRNFPWKFHTMLPIMSRIERKYCLISTSYLTRLFDISILLHIWLNCVCFGDFLPWGNSVILVIRNLNLISVQSWIYLTRIEIYVSILEQSAWAVRKLTNHVVTVFDHCSVCTFGIKI